MAATAWSELLRSLLRVVLVGGSGAWVVHGAFSRLLAMPHMDVATAVSTGVHSVLVALMTMVGALGLLAAIDVPWQRFQHRSRLKMTRQEVRDEAQGKRRQSRDQGARAPGRAADVAAPDDGGRADRRMSSSPTRPTTRSALKYEAGRMRAPKVVAKGVDEMALSIRDVAGKHRISIVEAPPLARALYRHAQIDREIPVNLYAAVAQVLSYVYQLKRWHPAHGPMPVLLRGAVDPKLSGRRH
jgi:flagellar biosynthetic protein FlhB